MDEEQLVSVACPSVFGAYPVLRHCGKVSLLGSAPGALCSVNEVRWSEGRFRLQMQFQSDPFGSSMIELSGGASSPRSLSQAVLSQCVSLDLPCGSAEDNTGKALADFCLDQLLPGSMHGLFRQASGIGSAGWLSISGLLEMQLTLQDPALLMGEVLRHPAAYMAGKWNSRSPLGGAEGKVPEQLLHHLQSAEPHLRAGGCLVLGPTATSRDAGGVSDLALPPHGWVMTGRRGGIEAMARDMARREGRPLLVVSRQEDAGPLLRAGVFTHVLRGGSDRSIGPFREKMIYQLMHNTACQPKLVAA